MKKLSKKEQEDDKPQNFKNRFLLLFEMYDIPWTKLVFDTVKRIASKLNQILN